ncbi:FixH family protein [Pedobacter vanadiisoli]|uniref:FixH family protein n=1 Tax=Pedobacter vanadiisoli TaxID=1761975 RepID=A0ABW5MP54_9SPHI
MNWGAKIVTGMTAFMLFIITMVIYMFSTHGNDALVDEDYYQKGINYDQQYKAKQNVEEENAQPAISISKSMLIIELKDSAAYELKLQRPSTAKDDFQIRAKTSGKFIRLNSTNMQRGLWLLELRWTSNNKEYLYNQTILL